MKAIAVYPGEKAVCLIEREEPRIEEPSQVKVRMLEVGVCGTDREIVGFEYGSPPEGADYFVLGHESLGEVVETGDGVARVREGDLVVPMVRRPCPHERCTACRSGRQDFCFTGDFTERGIKGAHGFMTEFLVEDEKYLTVLPRELRPFGVLTEPLTIAEKALMQVWDVQDRLPWTMKHRCDADVSQTRADAMRGRSPEGMCHHAVVLGAGPVGMLGALLLTLAGFQVFVYSREAAGSEKAKIVKSMGAHYISADDARIPELAKQVGAVDLVYEATGAAGVSFEMMKHLGANGVFVFTGVPGRKAPIELDASAIMKNLVVRNQVVFGTVNAGKDAYGAAASDLGDMMRRMPGALEALITRRYAMEEFEEPLLGERRGIKNVIRITDDRPKT